MISLGLSQGFGYSMITIQTQPNGAELFLNGHSLGKSPATVRVQNGMLAPKNMVRAELVGYQTLIMPLDQRWIPGITCAGTCCGLLFLPGFAILLYAKEHHPFYTLYLQKP